MIEKKEVEYAKEVDDVMGFVVGLLEDIVAGKSAMAIGSENIPALVEAVAGAQSIKDELMANKKAVLETVGSKLGAIAAVFV